MIPDSETTIEFNVGDIARIVGHNGSIPWDPDGEMEKLIGGEFEVIYVANRTYEPYLGLDTPLTNGRKWSWHWNPEDVELVNKTIGLVEPNHDDFEMLFK